MTIEKTQGKCSYCSGMFTKGGMSKHLEKCVSKQSSIQKNGKDGDAFLIEVYGKYNPRYWLFIEADASIELKDIDLFLRDIWLECCGHLSCFTIRGIQYDSSPSGASFFGKRTMSMKIKLNKILRTGLVFEHEYDFGTTTHLILRVISARSGSIPNKIKLIARNEPVKFKCVLCGKNATEMCSMCVDEKPSWFCKVCVKKHKCNDDTESENSEEQDSADM